MQKEEKKNETKRRPSKRRNCLQKFFHSFKYVMDHTNVCFSSRLLQDVNICTALCYIYTAVTPEHLEA